MDYFTPEQIDLDSNTFMEQRPKILDKTTRKFIENPALPYIRVKIDGAEYKLCEELAHHRWCNSKPGTYGQGLANTKDDETKVTRIGLLGEFALAKLTNQKVDIAYRENGDETDFFYAGIKSDIKCATYKRDKWYVQAINEKGSHVQVKSDLYLCAYIEDEQRGEEATVVLCGFQTGDHVRARPIVESPLSHARHKNHEITQANLLPITELIEWTKKLPEAV